MKYPNVFYEVIDVTVLGELVLQCGRNLCIAKHVAPSVDALFGGNEGWCEILGEGQRTESSERYAITVMYSNVSQLPEGLLTDPCFFSV